jgi:Flp pilus assembly protein TadD
MRTAALPALALALLMAGLCASAPAHTADTPEPAPAAAPDPLAGARAHIAASRWEAAVQDLRRVNATGSADWNNLMGYALRKQSTPDYAGARRHYDEALRLNPSHRGALEYAGELALLTGDLPTAERHLARLRQACGGSCEELTDLQAAVDRHKAGR